MKNKLSTLAALSILTTAFSSFAQEVVVDNDKTTSTAISIYNNNFAFVKDTRNVDFNVGNNFLAFAGVARDMKPETVMIKAEGISVVEQNYDYNLINQANLAQEYMGKIVKTAMYNAQTGQTTYDKAKIVESRYGMPILEFAYGIETNFPGRVIYENIPSHLRAKPTLLATISSIDKVEKPVEIAYLTNGVSWKANYVADIKGEGELDLQGWITLNNNSGVDYKDASINLIAGSVNQEEPQYAMDMAMPMMAKSSRAMGGMEVAAMPSREALGDYYLYALPVKATIKDQQSKQVSLLAKDNVKFVKDYRLESPLYMEYGVRENEFKKQKPAVIIKLKNEKEQGLGEPLPTGTVRFYEKDTKGMSQFLGESSIEQLAIGEKAELKIGKAFDISADGKIKSARKISDKIYEAEAEIIFNNAKDKADKVEFLQSFGTNWEVLLESQKSEKENVSTAKWIVEIPASGKATLTYKVRLINE